MNNRVKDAFDCIHAEDELKQNTINFLRQRCYEDKKSRRVPYKPLAAVMACMMLVLAGWWGYSSYFTSVSTISIDVNPSIELEVNRFDEVIAVESFNEDGAEIISRVPMRFLNYQEALERLLRDRSMLKYLTPDQVVEITVFGVDEVRNREMLENLTACTADYGNFYCAEGDAAAVGEAHSAGLSCGKYRAFLELQALNPDITVEDVKGLTMRQIRDQIAALSGDTENDMVSDSTESEKEEYGCGYGNGAGNGNGAGYGNGAGNGNGAGYGNGAGDGSGAGYGNGAGNGNGAGYGNGTGNGNGYRHGHGAGHRYAQ